MKNLNENWDGIERVTRNIRMDEAYITNPTMDKVIQYVQRAIEGNSRFPTSKDIMIQDLKNILDALKKIKK